MVQQGGVIVVKRPASAAAQFVGGRRGIVAAHHLRYAAQGPQCSLQSLLQRQEGLTGGDLSVAPSRVAEDQLEQQGCPAMALSSPQFEIVCPDDKPYAG